MSTQVAENPQTENVKSNVKPTFGNGRYSAEMERIYDASIKLFGIEPAKAEKIARQAGSDAGAIFRNTTAEIRVSKASKDGKVTIADASKAKGVTLTNPLAVVRAIQWIDDAGKNFVSYGFTSWKLDVTLQKWVDEMEVPTTK